jgi:uncharacterized membrane protein
MAMSVEVLPEAWLSEVISVLVRMVEIAGILIIFVGAVLAFGRFVAAMADGRERERKYNRIRLNLGRFIALGLEFQLAADVVQTAVAPTFDEIGQLAAIAAIRTALNFFLAQEIARESNDIKRGDQAAVDRDQSSRPRDPKDSKE